MRVFLFSLFTLPAILSSSQAFTDVAASQGVIMLNEGNSILGVGLSAYDYDKDGWDDLTFSSADDSLILYRNLGGTGFQRYALLEHTTDAKQPLWVDYDNDGDADLMWTKRSNGSVFYRNDGFVDGIPVLTDVTANLNLPSAFGVHIYGQCWGDYDRDGYLDVYLCTYNYTNSIQNYLLHNNGDGTFTDVAASAGVADGMRPTFQGVWQDMDFDGWPDLFVINDLGTFNELYMNDGDGTFTSITSTAGLAGDNMQSMSNSISDFDNDGDWDIYVTNVQDGNSFFLNNGSLSFTDIAPAAGVETNSWCWGANWIDYDHDRDDDLHVTTATTFINQDFLYTNNGDGSFTNPLYEEFADDFSYTYSSAQADFNHDGYWDLAVTASGDSAYQVMQNNGGSNNWVKVSLEGTFSNRDATGTFIEYFIEGNRYIKYTRAGENYLSQNSQHEILSLGDAVSIDSLVLTWPRGLVEKWYDVPANGWLSLVEGENTSAMIIAENDAVICNGGTITLDAGEWAIYDWSTDEDTRTIEVSEAGVYSVIVTDLNGYSFTTDIEISMSENPEVEVWTNPLLCWYSTNGMIEVTGNLPGDEILWSDESTAFLRENLGEGQYSFTVTNQEGCETSQSVELTAPDPIEASVESVGVTCYGYMDGTAEVIPSGGTGEPVIDWNGADPEALEAGDYEVVVMDENECELVVVVTVESPEPLTVEIATTSVTCYGLSDGTAQITATGGTGNIETDWVGANPESLEAGTYPVIVIDENLCSLESEYTIGEPDSLIAQVLVEDVLCYGDNTGTATPQVTGGTGAYDYFWNGESPAALYAGTYTLTVEDENDCTAAITFEVDQPSELMASVETQDAAVGVLGWGSVTPTGGVGPYSYLWSNNDEDSLAEDLEPGSYTCTITDSNGCTLMVEVEVGYSSVPVIAFQPDIRVYPNPASDQLWIDGCGSETFAITIMDMSGRIVYQDWNRKVIDITALASGQYFVRYDSGDVQVHQVFVKN